MMTITMMIIMIISKIKGKNCRHAIGDPPEDSMTMTSPPCLILTRPGDRPWEARREEVLGLVPCGIRMWYLPSVPGITRRAPPLEDGEVTTTGSPCLGE